METVEFHRLEEYGFNNHIRNSFVCVSFHTDRHGILQIEYGTNGIAQIDQEPDLHMFREEEQAYIVRASAIVYRMVQDTPAMTERFE